MRLKEKLGLLTNPYLYADEEKEKEVCLCEKHREIARRAAEKCAVLLKNENNVLPLKKGSKVALFGKGCADYVKGGGGSGDVTVAYIRNLCDGMEEKQEMNFWKHLQRS